ncbi:dickkopf-related protein 4 [Pseudorca crassidens]|uniref:dickkopf-related protein 4 n=1 Tax=Pseudorca crassidens TaxID=82174 RepID=UPI00352E69EE
MVVLVLLRLGWLCGPLGALVLDVNNKSSVDAQGARKGSQCMSDTDCNTRQFCLKPQDEKPSCATCRGLRRWCQWAAVCCPGTLCVNDVCTAVEDATPILERQIDDQDDTDTQGTNEHPIQENKPKRKPNIKKSQGTMGIMGDKREKAVLELSTVDLDFAVFVIFGLKFVNRSHWRDRSALGERTKIPRKLQKSSSAVTVVLDYHVEVRQLEINETHG